LVLDLTKTNKIIILKRYFFYNKIKIIEFYHFERIKIIDCLTGMFNLVISGNNKDQRFEPFESFIKKNKDEIKDNMLKIFSAFDKDKFEKMTSSKVEQKLMEESNLTFNFKAQH
jgi:hypothetical protein